ncbi:cAMP-dependent protein kinase type II regulatory subunit [Nematostella vectensis]|uniref:cAMP-dependent protein kinase type II regulatory subunit n=1 Tax=Nematostella vectensis TaxID=45351 RepID=UPI0013904098|nr:cAMP-dependent protein kinase type II regulatory subunit [Nematostella vectensis]
MKSDSFSAESAIRKVRFQQPDDLVDFAASYFSKLNTSRKPIHSSSTPSTQEEDDFYCSESLSLPSDRFKRPSYQQNHRLYLRRDSVAGEVYEPVNSNCVSAQRFYPKSEDARKRLENVIGNIFIFKSCGKDQINMMLDAMYERVVYQEETIIRQGDAGDNFYIIDEGEFEVLFETNGAQEKLGRLKGPGSFGELALMYNCPRSATIRACTPGVLWVLDRKSFRRILVDTTERKRRHYETLLERIPVLSQLTAYERTSLADALTTSVYRDEECIIRQDDPADCLYFIESGIVEISIRDSKDRSKVKVISTAGPGEYFGELALVNKTKRGASVHAKGGQVTCAVLEVNAFERLLGPCKGLMQRNMKTYEEERKCLGIREMPPKPGN